MKKLILLILFIACGLSVLAQNDRVITHYGSLGDNIRQEHERMKGENYRVGGWYTSMYPRFRGYWNGFYFGFVNFEGTDYFRYEGDKFMDVDWANSFAMQFNIAWYSIGLNKRDNFGLVMGIGLEYQRFYFDRKITVRKGEGACCNRFY